MEIKNNLAGRMAPYGMGALKQLDPESIKKNFT
jgi:hypothetical protein